MQPGSDSNPPSLPPALLAELEAVAYEEGRRVADVLRELVEQGLGERRWRAHLERERRRARELGVPDAEAQGDGSRQALRQKIADGVRSLREGKGCDGEGFMAQMDAELADEERQGHR